MSNKDAGDEAARVPNLAKLVINEPRQSENTGVLSRATNDALCIPRDQLGQRPFLHDTSAADNICPGLMKGIDYIRDPKLNKGLAFTIQERQALSIHGLLPARVKTQDEQIEQCLAQLERYTDDLNKYIYLSGLQDRHERLFYRLLCEHVEDIMPFVYTPIVGLACQKYGLIFRRPRGLFITMYDKGHVYDILRNWPEHDVRAIVVTDGQRILGLGDLGAYGMGIPVGKLALYTALAGVKPYHCLPIMIDVGTNTQDLLEDPFYIGIRKKRLHGEEYDALIDEFMAAVVRRYGQNTLIQFEDFGNENAFRLLDMYRNRYLTFNDDIQGTASVVVSGILTALRITRNKLEEHTFLFLGAGEASLGIAKLLIRALAKEGMTRKDAIDKIWLVDSHGLIVKCRPGEPLDKQKEPFAKDHVHMTDFEAMVKEVQPTCLIGAAAAPGAFTETVLKDVATYSNFPIVFALSNPTSKAECTAEEAYINTEGKAIFSSGSPFKPVEYRGKLLHPGQANNAYIFPGLALGVLCSGMLHIEEDLFLIAASALSELVIHTDLDKRRVYPPLSDIRKCSIRIATRVMEHAYKTGIATVHPEPMDKAGFIAAQLYDYSYPSSIPDSYSWPIDVV